jgi:hypothetical protein
MKIEILEFIENSDGSSKVVLELDEEAKEFLIEKGFNSFLLGVVDRLKTE